MAKTSVFPTTIRKMIATGIKRGMTAREIQYKINSSKTAKNLNMYFSVYQICAAMRYHR